MQLEITADRPSDNQNREGISMPGRDPKRVLVVEDEALLRVDIVDQFQARGWEVLDTASGESAVALMHENCIDVVFTDIQLEGPMCGWEVAERVRGSDPDIPVVYASGNAADRERQVPQSLFFDKPYDPDAVVSACAALCKPDR
jgi:CheY-like chemotaxis protein